MHVIALKQLRHGMCSPVGAIEDAGFIQQPWDQGISDAMALRKSQLYQPF